MFPVEFCEQVGTLSERPNRLFRLPGCGRPGGDSEGWERRVNLWCDLVSHAHDERTVLLHERPVVHALLAHLSRHWMG